MGNFTQNDRTSSGPPMTDRKGELIFGALLVSPMRAAVMTVKQEMTECLNKNNKVLPCSLFNFVSTVMPEKKAEGKQRADKTFIPK